MHVAPSHVGLLKTWQIITVSNTTGKYGALLRYNQLAHLMMMIDSTEECIDNRSCRLDTQINLSIKHI